MSALVDNGYRTTEQPIRILRACIVSLKSSSPGRLPELSYLSPAWHSYELKHVEQSVSSCAAWCYNSNLSGRTTEGMAMRYDRLPFRSRARAAQAFPPTSAQQATQMTPHTMH